MEDCAAADPLLGCEQDGLIGLIPKTCLENLPRRELISLRHLCPAEIKLDSFMKAAGLVNIKTDPDQSSNFKGKGESSPTNVIDCLERQRGSMQGHFTSMTHEQEPEGVSSHNFDSFACPRAPRPSKRKELSLGLNPEEYHLSRKKIREDCAASYLSPKRSKFIDKALFSPDRTQAASNLVGLKKKIFGSLR